MIEITSSVGLKGINSPADTGKIQTLLNQNRHNDPASREISEDNIIGPHTISAIKQFQEVVVKLRRPDSRVDPGGKTLRVLNEGAIAGKYMDEPVRLAVAAGAAVAAAAAAAASLLPGTGSTILFPLSSRPGLSYKTGARYFGAKRHGGRKHAGCDLIAPTGTEIRAVADGEIKKFYLFYSGTYALEVLNTGGMMVRYGEVSGMGPGLKVGSDVKRGQLIAYVGRLRSGSHMLHIEMYTGTESGRLTVRRNKPYQRRSDLTDPTPILDGASMT